MYVRFDANLANALINGQPLPVQFVHEFVQNAYEAFQYAQQTHASNTEKDARIKQLEGEISVVKAALLDAEEELNKAKEDARIAQEQRNASNRRIEELQDELHAFEEKEERRRMDDVYFSTRH